VHLKLGLLSCFVPGLDCAEAFIDACERAEDPVRLINFLALQQVTGSHRINRDFRSSTISFKLPWFQK
jgi:hypothetical protein